MPSRTKPHQAPLPLLLTGDADLLEDLLRLAATAGAEVSVAPDPAAARSRYGRAPMVLVGIDQAQACLRTRLPRRPRVVLVGRAETSAPWELAELIGAQHVAILPDAEPWLVERFADGGAVVDGRVIALLGGRGGAGASVLSVAMALTSVNASLRTLLVDADPLGGGLDLLLGWEDLDGLRWPEMSEAEGRVDAPAFVRALPGRGDLALLSWDRGELVNLPPHAMAATVDAGRRGRDIVVIDLPRRLDDAAVLALEHADRALLVVPAELRATAAAARVAATAAPHCADLSVVVRGPAPGRLQAREVAQALGLPLAGSLRPEPGLAASLERGEAPGSGRRGPLASLCRRLLGDLCGTAGRAAA
jgi:secretion/DNA translocation related CpaE-like protein